MSWKGVDAGENRALTPVVVDDDGVKNHYLVEGIAAVGCVFSLVLFRGKLQIWESWIGRYRRFRRRFTSWGHLFGAPGCWWLWWSGFFLHRVFGGDVKSCLIGKCYAEPCLFGR
jgi:hypothetical protein